MWIPITCHVSWCCNCNSLNDDSRKRNVGLSQRIKSIRLVQEMMQQHLTLQIISIKVSAMLDAKEPALEKSLSDGTDVAGTARNLLASWDSGGRTADAAAAFPFPLLHLFPVVYAVLLAVLLLSLTHPFLHCFFPVRSCGLPSFEQGLRVISVPRFA